MRISDWSSDVCSSDLLLAQGHTAQVGADPYHDQPFRPDRPCAVLLRVGQVGTVVHSCLGNLLRRAVVDEDGLSPPTHRDALTQLNRAQIDLDRSEEHTSELQSLMRISYAVFCLKKKQ